MSRTHGASDEADGFARLDGVDLALGYDIKSFVCSSGFRLTRPRPRTIGEWAFRIKRQGVVTWRQTRMATRG